MEINKYYDLVTKKIIGWAGDIIQMLPNFVLAIIVLVTFVLIGRLVRNLLRRLLTKTLDNRSLSSLISKIIYTIILTIGSFAALSLMNLDKTVTSLLAGAGILGLALGFAFQDIATNFIAGFFMAIRRPFKIGQIIH